MGRFASAATHPKTALSAVACLPFANFAVAPVAS